MRVVIEQSWTRSEQSWSRLDLSVDDSPSTKVTQPTMHRNPRALLPGPRPVTSNILHEAENDR